MIKIENVTVHGFEAAIRGMRNPMNSWEKSDSKFNVSSSPTGIWLGAMDKKRMLSLVKSGSDHRKFMRMITVSCDIIALFIGGLNMIRIRWEQWQTVVLLCIRLRIRSLRWRILVMSI